MCLNRAWKQMNPLLLFAAFFLLLTACKSTPLESTANTLNRDLDLVRSPYQYTPTPEKDRLIRVLRKMPVGQTAADATLRADLERAIAAKLGSAPRIVEIRIFETQPNLRREVWVAEKDAERFAFDVILRPHRTGVSSTVEGPVLIEGAL
jgi:hypothetical protein